MYYVEFGRDTLLNPEAKRVIFCGEWFTRHRGDRHFSSHGDEFWQKKDAKNTLAKISAIRIELVSESKNGTFYIRA